MVSLEGTKARLMHYLKELEGGNEIFYIYHEYPAIRRDLVTVRTSNEEVTIQKHEKLLKTLGD